MSWGCYAALDELHQVFVPGRTCLLQDWLIDTAGAFVGIGLVVLWAFKRRTFRNG